MRLEDQVCSLEFAKRLKELGVMQESIFYWIYDYTNKYENQVYPERGWVLVSSAYRHNPAKNCDAIAAFSVAELGEMLPEKMSSYRAYRNSENYQEWICIDINATKKNPMDRGFVANTEADARAKMLIHLIEKGIVKP